MGFRKPRRLGKVGYVYILSNSAMPGLFKVGYTNRPVKIRVKELSASTGVPVPFKVEKVFRVKDAFYVEQDIHKALSRYRVNRYREFFKAEKRLIFKHAARIASRNTESRSVFSYEIIIALFFMVMIAVAVSLDPIHGKMTQIYTEILQKLPIHLSEGMQSFSW